MDPTPSQMSAEERTARFMRLYARSERRVFAFVLSLVGNLEDANDIIQEACVRLWEQFDQYDPEKDFGTWACTIAYYQVLTMRKQLRSSKLRFGEEFYRAVAEEAERMAESIDARQSALLSCLDRLEPRQQELLRKCYSGRGTVQEVAVQLGRSLGATYSTLFRIRRRLRDCIERNLGKGAVS